MEKNKKCDKGWKNGSCCCNCKNQVELFKHPWNNGSNKGAMSESTGTYACLVFASCNKAIFYDSKHGFCELYEEK